MVNISIDVTDLGGEARPGDKVVFWRPRMGGSATHAGRVISTAPVTVFLTDGKAMVSDVEPGEMTVLLQCRGIESQGPVTVGVPDGNGTVTLRSLIESQFEYAPPIVSAVQEAAANASASERAAIEAQVRSEAAADRADAKVDDAINNGANLVRNEVKQDADRAVSARQAAVQSESNAKASESAAATSESNAAASESAAKQSETNAGDYAAVATTAATEAVDAMERATDLAGGDFATHEYVDGALTGKADKSYVDSVKWLQSQVPTGTDLNTLTTPSVRVLPNGEQPNKPFPGTGVIEILPIIGGGTMQRATNFLTLEVWKRRTVNGVFASWSVEPTKAVVDSKADKSYADTKADKSYVDSVKWLQPQVPATADLDTYTTPCVRILLFSTQPNKPFDGTGVLEVLPIVGGGTIQRATDYRTLEVWKRKTEGKVFQEWKKEPTNETVTQTVTGILDNSPVFTQEWTRKYPLMVTTGAAASNYSPGGDYRVRVQFTAPILRWRLHISTVHPYSTTHKSAADLSGVRIGLGLGDGEMEDGEVLLGTNTTIEEGGEWVSDWTRYDLRQDSLLALTVNRHGTYSDFLLAGWLNQNGTWVRKQHIPIWIWIEAETYSATPSVALIGDSTGAGHGSIEPVWDSAVAIAGRKQEFLPVLYAASGDNLANYTNPDRNILKRWEHFARADSTVIQAGSNDIHGGSSLAQMKTTFERVLPIAKKLGVKIYAATIKPRYPVGNMEDVRLAYNEWLKTLPFGIDGVIDYNGAVAPDEVILPEDNADGAHLTKSGQMKLASAYSFPITRPRVTETWKP